MLSVQAPAALPPLLRNLPWCGGGAGGGAPGRGEGRLRDGVQVLRWDWMGGRSMAAHIVKGHTRVLVKRPNKLGGKEKRGREARDGGEAGAEV